MFSSHVISSVCCISAIFQYHLARAQLAYSSGLIHKAFFHLSLAFNVFCPTGGKFINVNKVFMFVGPIPACNIPLQRYYYILYFNFE